MWRAHNLSRVPLHSSVTGPKDSTTNPALCPVVTPRSQHLVRGLFAKLVFYIQVLDNCEAVFEQKRIRSVILFHGGGVVAHLTDSSITHIVDFTTTPSYKSINEHRFVSSQKMLEKPSELTSRDEAPSSMIDQEPVPTDPSPSKPCKVNKRWIEECSKRGRLVAIREYLVREIDLAATALAAPEAGLSEIYPNPSDPASIETPADSLANQNQCSGFKVSSRKRGRVSRAPKRNESRHAGTDIPALGADLEPHTRRDHTGYSKISHADATVSTTDNVASQLPVSLSTVGLDQQHDDRPPTPQNTCSSPITVGLTLAASTCSYSTASTGPPTSTSSSAEVATGSESEHSIVSDRIRLHTVTQYTEARLSSSPVAAEIEVTWLEGDFARSCKTTGDRFVSASSDAGQSVAQTDREISLSPSCKGMPEDTAELNNADECMIASLPASVPIATSPNPTYVAGSDAPNLPGCSASDPTASITTSPRSGRARISLNEGGNDHTPYPIQADAVDVIDLTQLPKDSDNDSDLDELVSEHGDYDQREIGIDATLGSTIEGSSNINHSIEQLGQQEMLDTMECVKDVKAEVQVTVSTNGTAVEEEHKTAVSELPPNRRIFWASFGLPLSLYVIASRNSQVKHHLLIQGVGSGYIGSPYHATFLVVDMPNTGADVPLDEGWRKIVKEAMDNPARAVVSAEWVIHSLDALQLLDLEPYALLLDEHILRRCYPVPAPPSTEARPATRDDEIKDDKTREASARPAVMVEQLEQADKAVSTAPTAVKRRAKRASEPLVVSDAHAGPNRRPRAGRPSTKARQSMPAIPTKRSRRDTTESDLTSSSGSNYSPHALSPLEIRPTLRSDLRKVMDRERDAFLGIQPERPKKKSRLEKDWGFIEELDVVLEEDELAYDVLLDSIRLWIENNDKKDSEEKEVFDKTALLADLQERSPCGEMPYSDMYTRYRGLLRVQIPQLKELDPVERKKRQSGWKGYALEPVEDEEEE